MVKKNIKNILIRAPNWIGDAVLCLPALETVKTAFPEADIYVLSNPRVNPVFLNIPFIKNIIVYDTSGKHKGIYGKLNLIKEIRKYSFDMAILFQNAFEAAMIAFLAKIPIRTGYNRDLRGLLLTHPIRLSNEIRNRHQVFYYLNIISKGRGQGAGGRGQNKGTVQQSAFKLPQPIIYLTDDEKAWARDFLKSKNIGNRLIVGIAPGASYGPAKRWIAERFAEAAKRLSHNYNADLVLFGGDEERNICSAVLNNLKGINIAGEVDLRKAIAIMNMCKLFITNDSGPMHIAASLGLPTVAIFGSTDPKLTGPLGNNVKVIKKECVCSPCFDRVCKKGHYNCMYSITTDEVYEAAKNFLV